MRNPRKGKPTGHYIFGTLMLLIAVLGLAACSKEEPKQLRLGRFVPINVRGSLGIDTIALDTMTGRACIPIAGMGGTHGEAQIPSCDELLRVENLNELSKINVKAPRAVSGEELLDILKKEGKGKDER